MKLTKQQKSARKAVRTTRARRELKTKYGAHTYEVARYGFSLFSSYASDAAVKANINRPGKLQDLVKKCNFK